MSSKVFPSTGEKPKFNPDAAYEVVQDAPAPKREKPAFNPNKKFEVIKDSQPEAQEQPKQEQSAFKPMTDWLNMPHAAQPIVQGNAVNEHTAKTSEASERVRGHLNDIDNSIRNLLYEHKKELGGRLKSQQLAVNPSEGGPINYQAQELAQKDKQDVYVSPVEVESFKSEMPNNPVLLRRALGQKVKDLTKINPAEANALKADIYRLDRQNNPDKESKISKNIDKIHEGEYDYDIVDERLVKPEGFFGSLATGYKEKVQTYDDYGVYKSGDEKAMLALINKRLKDDPDEAVPVPEDGWIAHPLAEGARMVGGQPLKPLIGGGIAGYFAGPQAAAAAAAAISAPEMYKLTFGTALPHNYAALKHENPNLSESEVLQKAIDLTNNQANVDAASGAAMGALGELSAFKPTGLNRGLLQKSLGSALTQIGQTAAKKTLEGLGVGSVGAAGQVVKNLLAQNAGLSVDTGEGIKEQLIGGVGMTMGMTLIAKFPEVLKPKTYNQLLQSFKGVPKEVIETNLNNLEQTGQITPEQSQAAQKTIQEHQTIDNSIKPNVPESDRLKVQELIKKRNELEASLETEDKAYHTDTKEKIKALNDQINNVSKGQERGELQQLVDKEHKAGNLKEFTTEVLRNSSENDLNKYFKEIAEQVYSGNEESAIQAFGENIVSKAKELYPKKESAVSVTYPKKTGTETTAEGVTVIKPEMEQSKGISVIQPGEIKHPETITIGGRAAQSKAVNEHTNSLDDLNNRAKKLGYNGIKQLNTQEALNENASPEVKKLLNEYGEHNKKVKSLTNETDISNLDDDNFGTWVKANDVQRDSLGRITKQDDLSNASKRIRILKKRGLAEEAANETERLRASKKKDNWTVEEWNKRFDEELSKEEVDVINKENLEFNKQLDKELNNLESSTIKSQDHAQDVRGNQGQLPEIGEVGTRSEEIGGNDVQQIPPEAPISGEAGQQTGSSKEEGNAQSQEGKVEELKVDEAYGLPFIDEPGDKKTGIKNFISKTTRFERSLPSVEVDKLGSDQEVLQRGKELVDGGEVNPVDVVNRIIEKRGGMEPDEAKAMQYYMHQLSQHETNLRERLAHATNEEERANVNGQLQQLSDEVDAATQANIISGKAWSDVGNIRQIVADNGFNASRDLAVIKEAYGGKIPKEVQAKLDLAMKERDAAMNQLLKLQAEQTHKLADEAVKKAAKKNPKKTKDEFNTERDDIKKSISDKLKRLKKGGGGTYAVPLPLVPQFIEIAPDLLNMVKSYAEEGVQKTEEVINRLYDLVKDEMDGVQKADIVNFLAGKYKDEERRLSPIAQRARDYKMEANLWTKIADATKMEEDTPQKKQEKNDKLRMLKDRLNDIRTKNKEATKSIQDILTSDAQKELQKLERNRKALETQLRNKKFLVSSEKKNVPLSTEIAKEKQRIVNAQYKIRVEKRKAFESQKNMYQKSLMWMGRAFRLSVLSGYNVLGKLAAASTLGGAGKRIPEQAIGFIYGQVFRDIARKAPIEGFVNAGAEAKFYKEFFNPKTFAKNAWQILKTGESPLSKKFSSGQYEHIPGIYLPTDLHQIIKDPLKRATFEASFKNGLAWAERNGLDINDDLVIQSVETAAYKRAQYEIFQESNALSRKFSEWKSNMEKSGNIGATGKFVADFLIPVSTVPANIARRLATTSPFGLLRGGAKVIEAYRKGIENLTPEQADSVMKQLKQGTLGTALWLVGWYASSYFGGLYSKFNPNKERDQGELESDEMSVGGKMIPKPIQHALPLEIIQFAATARHVYDHYRDDKRASLPESIEKAGLASIGALTEQIPVIETAAHTMGAFNNPYEAKKLEDDAKRRFVPQILRETGVIPKKENDNNSGGAGATGSFSKPSKPTRASKPHKTHR